MLRVAAVSRDDAIRLQLARAFDSAPASWDIALHDSSPPEADVVVCGPDQDISGCIRFDPADPEKVIADIRAATPSTRTRSFVVTGAAGGGGATSVALHLTVLSGGCIFGMEQGLRRRLKMPTAKSWSDALSGDPIELCALPVAPGFRVLLAPDEFEVGEDRRVFDLARATFDHVFVDVAVEHLDRFAGRGDVGVLVMPPTRPGAERAAELLASHSALRWAIVTNRLGPGSGLTRRRLEEITGKKIAVELPCSAALRDAEDDGRVVTSPLSPWLWQLKRLWRTLATA